MKTIEFSSPSLQKLALPQPKSHKGENGRVLVIGGSSLFHSASLWAAELLAHFVDLVFYFSPEADNHTLFLKNKERFRNGIVVEKKDLDNYLEEADAVLIGPGLRRRGVEGHNEGKLTGKLTNRLLQKYPNKKWVIDAGALQELEVKNIHPQQILTPHWNEFISLFPGYENNFSKLITDYPAAYLIKHSGIDYCLSQSDPGAVIRVEAGNEGLTKGGTGDLLAALVAALYVKNTPLLSVSAASYILNKTAEKLYSSVGPFFTTSELLTEIPEVFWNLLKTKS